MRLDSDARRNADDIGRIIEALLEDDTDIGIKFNTDARGNRTIAEFSDLISRLVLPDHEYAGHK